MKAGCRVKICGLTSYQDALLAAWAGAHYLGFVLEVDFSPRSVTLDEAEPIFASPPGPAVALVYGMQPERVLEMVNRLNPFAVQFLSLDGPDLASKIKTSMPQVQVWQSLHLPPAGTPADLKNIVEELYRCEAAGVDFVLFDTVAVIEGKSRFGGTGRTSNWDMVKELMALSPLPAFLAGGVNPTNVREAIETLQPFGIDLCSGVEAFPGKKSPEKLKELMEEVKRAKVG